MSYRMRWTLSMTAVGLATALIVYVLTASVVWAVVGLLASGFVLNLFAEAVTNRASGKRARTRPS
jgi:hypothetical protein